MSCVVYQVDYVFVLSAFHHRFLPAHLKTIHPTRQRVTEGTVTGTKPTQIELAKFVDNANIIMQDDSSPLDHTSGAKEKRGKIPIIAQILPNALTSQYFEEGPNYNHVFVFARFVEANGHHA